MPTIDVHTHILPPQLPRWAERFGYGGFVNLERDGPCQARLLRDDGSLFRAVAANSWDPQQRLEDCDAAGVHVQVLSTVPVLFAYHAQGAHGLEVAQFLNDHLAEVCARHPTRFVGLATLPMQAPDLAVAELERCRVQLGLRGVQIASHIRGVNLDDPSLRTFWQRAAALGAAVFIHPWEMMGQETMPRHWLPWLVGMPAESARAICSLLMGGVLEENPTLRLCVAHGGGSFPGTLGRIDHGWRVRPDLCASHLREPPSQAARRIWVDTLVHDAAALRRCLAVFGEDKLVIGSDYPFPLGEAAPGELVRGVLRGSRLRRRVEWQNAWDWLGGEVPHLASEAVNRRDSQPLSRGFDPAAKNRRK